MSDESIIPFLGRTKKASRFKTTPFLESTPVQPTQQNKPEGLPAINRTSKKC